MGGIVLWTATTLLDKYPLIIVGFK